jgi:xylulose-5-phosphate/fructose-6-phosphate phosphoketolase
VPRLIENAGALSEKCVALLAEHEAYIRAHFDDLPEIKDWVWSE